MINIQNETYSIIRVLGTGGMSTVYLAEHRRLHTRVAIKRISKKKLKEGNFDYEYRLLKKLHHPMLPYVLDAFEDADFEYIVEEYIPGKTLKQVLEEQGRLEEDTGRRWMLSLCDVLQYLHNQSPAVIYRDIKPSNIMVQPDGTLKLLDFGIARENTDTSISSTNVGSYGYAAPEQLGHGPVDERTDIYGLGMTFHHLLTGKSPYDPPYTLRPARELNPLLSVGMNYVLLKCTQANPARRYRDIRSLRYDLEHLYTFEKKYKQYKMRLWARRATVAVLLGLSLVLLGTGIWKIAATLLTSPAQQEDAYRVGLKLMEQSRYEEAIQSFTAALESANPGELQTLYLARGDAYYAAAQQETQAEPALTLLEQAMQDYDQTPDTKRQQAVRQLMQQWQDRQDSTEILANLYDLCKSGNSDAVYDFIGGEEYDNCLNAISGDSMSYYSQDGTEGVTLYRDYALIYFGQMTDGQREGVGSMWGLFEVSGTDMELLYTGNWSQDKPNGAGSVSLRNRNTAAGNYLSMELYTGNFTDGLLDGPVEMTITFLEKKSADESGTVTAYQLEKIYAKNGILQPLPESDLPSWYDPGQVEEGTIPVGYDDDAQEIFSIQEEATQTAYGMMPFGRILGPI